MSIFWAEGPLRPHASPGPDTWATPADGRTYYVRILGDPIPVWLHWVASRNRTVPCTGLECEHCPQIRQQWKGYCPALLFDGPSNTWKPVIAELTENARNELLGDEYKPILQWRGTIVKLCRGSKGVHATVDDRLIIGELPPSWDIKPTLIRMWQIRQPVLPSKDTATAGELPETLPFKRRSQ